MLTLTATGGATATADLIVAANLDRNLNREVVDTQAGGVMVTAGPVRALGGTIIYLCGTFTQRAALEALYCSAAALTASGTDADAIAGWPHYAVGSIRSTAERAIPGQRARWLVQVTVKGTL